MEIKEVELKFLFELIDNGKCFVIKQYEGYVRLSLLPNPLKEILEKEIEKNKKELINKLGKYNEIKKKYNKRGLEAF